MGFLYPLRGKRLHSLIQIGCAAALALFGWDAGVIGGVISTPAFLEAINFDGNSALLTFCVAGILLGDVFGCLIVSNFVFRVGRRLCIIWACYVGLIGVILQTSTFSAVQMIIGRILLGVGNGIISAVVPAYVQEIGVAGPAGRTYDILITIGIGVFGIAAANWVDYGMYKSDNPNAWRAPIAVQAVFLIIGLIVFHGITENPRWLYAKHREAEGDDALSRLLDLPVDDEQLLAQKSEIMASIRLEEQDSEGSSLSFKLLFQDKSQTQVARRIWLAWAVALGAPLFGGNVIVFYSSSIFGALGLSTDTVQILTATLQTASPVGMCFAFYALPRFGRRPLLVWGGAAQVTMMVLFTVLSNLKDKTTIATQWAAIACLYVFQLVNGVAWIWIPYLYCVEIVPTKYRGQVISIGNATFWAIAFVEVYASPIALERSTGTKIFIWFCITGACVLAAVIWLAKETKDLTLEQIDILWATDEYKAQNAEARIIEETEAKKLDFTTEAEN